MPNKHHDMQKIHLEALRRWKEFDLQEVDQIEGDLDELVRLLIKTYGYTKEVAQAEVDRMVSDLKENLEDKAHAAVAKAQNIVRTHRWETALGVLGLGFILVWVFKLFGRHQGATAKA